MTKRDFELIAKGIREAYVSLEEDRQFIAESLADILHSDNQRFDRRRFYEACTRKERR